MIEFLCMADVEKFIIACLKIMLKRTRIGALVVIMAGMLLSSGCASMFGHTEYPVTISSNPSEANLTVKDRNGVEVYRGKTPAVMVLKSNAGFFKAAKYSISCEKEDYMPAETSLSASLNGWIFGNLLFLPLGTPIGIMVDGASGSMWKLNNLVSVNLPEKTK